MKIAIVYNRESKKVINLFGTANQERIGLRTIKRIADALREGGHTVRAMEGDADLIDKLGDFMPRVVKGERPGMVFNVSYGIQGQARYTHVPGILEMVGVPYVGSGPLAHSLALDKVVAKMIFRQNGLPTPDFAVLTGPEIPLPNLPYPLIVKPKNEAVSFGLRIVTNDAELLEAAQTILDHFKQSVLVERYIEGREINVGLLGNHPPETLPPAEILFPADGPPIYTYEDKTRRSGRDIRIVCPAEIDPATATRAGEIALGAFSALGCFDCARVDMRLDDGGKLYILEVNSLPSLGEHGSYVQGAQAIGLDYPGLVNRLVEVASARYFGTPSPTQLRPARKEPEQEALSFLSEHRDRLEKRVEEWCRLKSRTSDPVGLQEAAKELDRTLAGLKMKPVQESTDGRSTRCWETARGMEGGTLLLGHLDVPLSSEATAHGFRRDPEHLFGEGIASSRAPLTMMEYALRSLRAQRRLHHLPIGVFYYMDEGRDCRYSGQLIRDAATRVKRVLVLRPGNPGDRVITQRRGQRKYLFAVAAEPRRPGRASKKAELLRWVFGKLDAMCRLTSVKDRVSVSVIDLKPEAYPMLLPHRVSAQILLTYGDEKKADETERAMRELLRDTYRGDLELISDRPPMKERRGTLALFKALRGVADAWEIPLRSESSVWPSAAGLIPARTPVLCGLGPVAEHLHTPQESIQRISLMQRTLLLAQFLLKDAASRERKRRR